MSKSEKDPRLIDIKDIPGIIAKRRKQLFRAFLFFLICTVACIVIDKFELIEYPDERFSFMFSVFCLGIVVFLSLFWLQYGWLSTLVSELTSAIARVNLQVVMNSQNIEAPESLKDKPSTENLRLIDGQISGPVSVNRMTNLLRYSKDPIQHLQNIVRNIQDRKVSSPDTLWPIELYLCQELLDTGILDHNFELPEIRTVFVKRTNLLYFSFEEDDPDIRNFILAIESAYNRSILSAMSLEDGIDIKDPSLREDIANKLSTLAQADPSQALEVVHDCNSEDELVSLRLAGERLSASVPQLINAMSAVVHDADAAHELDDEDPIFSDTTHESSFRYALASAFESFPLTQRYVANFNCNLKQGLVGIELELPAPSSMPKHLPNSDATGLVALSQKQQRFEADFYYLQLIALSARAAYKLNPSLKEIRISGYRSQVEEGAKSYLQEGKPRLFKKNCYLFSLGIEVEKLLKLSDCPQFAELLDFCKSAKGQMSYSFDQGFSFFEEPYFKLDDADLAPQSRFEPIGQISTEPSQSFKDELQISSIKELDIVQNSNLSEFSNTVLRRLGTVTQDNVKMILELIEEANDPKISQTGQRLIDRMISGDFSEESESFTEEVQAEILAGDELGALILRVEKLNDQNDFATAFAASYDTLLKHLDEIQDVPGQVEYRDFELYSERVLYQLMLKSPDAKVERVPNEIVRLLYRTCIAAHRSQNIKQAISLTEEFLRITPYQSIAYAILTDLYLSDDRLDDAIKVMIRYLDYVPDPEDFGWAYYRLAFLYSKKGSYLLARACYRFALDFLKDEQAQNCYEELQDIIAKLEEIDPDMGISDGSMASLESEALATLKSYQLPTSINPIIPHLLNKVSRLAMDENLFGLARSLMFTLYKYNPDDVVWSTFSSLTPKKKAEESDNKDEE